MAFRLRKRFGVHQESFMRLTQLYKAKKYPSYKQMQSMQNSALPGLLNISSMRLVIMNPPVMLILDTSVASAASEVAVLLGSTPPPIKTNPPAAVMPEIALVTDIRGE